MNQITTPTFSTQVSDQDYRLARRRAKARLGFMIHAMVYLVVGVGMIGIHQLLGTGHGYNWPLWPLAGWSIGLFFHGMGVYVLGSGSGIRQRMIEAELQRLQSGRAAVR